MRPRGRGPARRRRSPARSRPARAAGCTPRWRPRTPARPATARAPRTAAAAARCARADRRSRSTRSVPTPAPRCPGRPGAPRLLPEAGEQEADPGPQPGRHPAERGARVRLAGRVGEAPVDQLRMASELRADLADPVAQRDHVAEPLPGELRQVLGPAPADVDAVLAHHPYRLRVQRLRMAARARHLDRAPGQLPE